MPAALLFAGSRLAVFLPPFPVFFFGVMKLSYIAKTLAKPRAREGQRPRCLRFAADPLVLTDALHASDLLPKMRIRFGTILSPPLMWQWNVLTIYHRRINNRSEKDENMVWTDSQAYGVDEILSHPFALTPPVQRAACALLFEGSVPSRINRNHPINQISITLFNLSHSLEGCDPRFSLDFQ